MLLRPLQDPAQHRLEVFGYPVQNDRDGLQVHGNQRDNEGHNDPRDAQAMSDPDGATVAVEGEADVGLAPIAAALQQERDAVHDRGVTNAAQDHGDAGGLSCNKLARVLVGYVRRELEVDGRQRDHRGYSRREDLSRAGERFGSAEPLAREKRPGSAKIGPPVGEVLEYREGFVVRLAVSHRSLP